MFCPENATYVIWIDHGFPKCFFSIITDCLPFGFIFLFGLAQIWFYDKYGHKIEEQYVHKSYLYNFQLFLHVLMIFEALVNFAIETTIINKNQYYGHLIMGCAFNVITWLIAILLLFVERRRALPSIPSRGHGLILLIFWSLMLVLVNIIIASWKSKNWFFKLESKGDYYRFSLWIFRYLTILIIFIVGLKAPGVPKKRYSLVIANQSKAKQEANKRSTWTNVLKKLYTLGAYLWPRDNLFLQLIALLCILILVALRVTGILLPIYSKYVVDSLTNATSNQTIAEGRLVVEPIKKWPWSLIATVVLIRFLQGSGTGGTGFFNNLRYSLWTRVQQYTSLNIALKLFSHLHSLSLKWHLNRKTGEVLRIVSRGCESVNNLTNYLLFNIIPTFIDLFIAIAYFMIAFNMWFGIITLVSVIFYLFFTISITEWRTKFRRELIDADNALNAKAVDSLINFETVKYFNAEKYEVDSYKNAFKRYQKIEWTSNLSLWLLNFSQNITISLALLVGTLYCGWLIVNGELTVGDYVLYITYVTQLYAPLNWLGTYYRMIQQAFIDMESMFDLLDEELDVHDEANATELKISQGLVEFENVSFAYTPDRPILQNISFKVLPGQTLAIVGASGAGKSTIARLLFRFYDISSGAIKIDGQNIKEVTQESLRRQLGVVPQDTVLFNADIKYNIKYGRFEAPDQEVIQAAMAADLHEKILTFEKGYETLVGERGLKLSGGEKQRVSIARTILKSPQIVILDEATSALDTNTERNIQQSLKRISENRTTIVIAHRLSTIIHANQIIVLRDGYVYETGTHQELISLSDGLYAQMWNQQQQSFMNAEVKTESNEPQTV